MRLSPDFAYLVVNADDYGYSEGVSRGILEAVREGAVTAVGIFANSPFFDDHLDRLLPNGNVDLGVHLNLTSGRPLTRGLGNLFRRSGGVFSGNKFRMALAILSKRIDMEIIEEEWDAQIRRCRDAGVKIRFVNSHEHLHMLPPVYRLTLRLAEKHGIPNMRHSSAEWFGFPRSGNIMRELMLLSLDCANRNSKRKGTPVLLGTGSSGKIDRAYLERRLEKLERGAVYELMCHPGMSIAGSDVNPRLAAYHDWDGELQALLAAKGNGWFDTGPVRLIRYRDFEN